MGKSGPPKGALTASAEGVAGVVVLDLDSLETGIALRDRHLGFCRDVAAAPAIENDCPEFADGVLFRLANLGEIE